MQWHIHDNLCWGLDENGNPVVRPSATMRATCPDGTIKAGGENPMVHVWIAPHECGPFAALEGHGAGQVGGRRSAGRPMCARSHGATGGDTTARSSPTPYDPTQPIDLGGVAGRHPAATGVRREPVGDRLVRDLPQWADPAVAEAAGFHSIGDGAHRPRALHPVGLDRRRRLARRRLPGEPRLRAAIGRHEEARLGDVHAAADTALDEVPDWGGSLMQWHVHDDLCFTDDPVAPQVRSVTTVGGPCSPPFVRFLPAPMIHVWIVPHECGPFAALEGVGAGQIAAGEDRWCDTAHGSH